VWIYFAYGSSHVHLWLVAALTEINRPINEIN
jgi:hypothetical protein